MICRLKYFLLIAFLSPLILFAQKGNKILTKILSGYIYTYTLDSNRNVLYYGGNPSSAVLGALNAKTGDTLWGYQGGQFDAVRQMIFSNDTIYFAGSFSQIKSLPRNNIAAMDINGNVLAWNPASNGVSIATPLSMDVDKNYLYVAQQYSPTISIISKAGEYLVNSSITVDDAPSSLIKIVCRDSFIFALTETGLVVYKWQYDISGAPSALKIVADENLSPYGYYYDPGSYENRGGGDLAFNNNEIFVVDTFNYAGKKSGALKYDWDPLTMKLTKLNYDVDVFSLCSAITVYPDTPPYLSTEPKLNSGIFYDAAIYFGGYDLSDLSQGACGNPFPVISSNPVFSNTSKAANNKMLFGPNYYDARRLKIVNSILYQVSTRQYGTYPDTYTRDYISARCLTPAQPDDLNIFKANVCPEDSAIKYQVPNVAGFTYKWTYSGTGVTIHSSGTNSITMDFSSKPTSGYLSVTATNICGLVSQAQLIRILVNTPPDVNAGTDQYLNCKDSVVALSGSSTSPNVIYNWKHPDATTSVYPQFTTNKIGKYILTVTSLSTGCHWRDTAFVKIDTIHPKPSVSPGNYLLTCKIDSVLLNGVSLDSNDTLRWIYGSGNSSPNHLWTKNPDIYTLSALNKKNQCTATTSVTVSSNKTYPDAAIILTSTDLTCKNDTIVLTGTSSTRHTKLKWIGGGDTLANPASISKAGIYLFEVIDTSDGCPTTKSITINNKQNKPDIVVPASQSITCSTLSLSLTGSSGTANTVLAWSGPGNYVSTNPATVKNAGIYKLTVTDTSTGCSNSKQDTISLKPVLDIKVSADTAICPGSAAIINAAPVGGTPTYLYTWKNNNSVIGNNNSQSVSPNDTTIYTVAITDKAGCSGKGSIRVNVPKQISSTIKAFQPCDPNNAKGQLQVAATNGKPPYSYSINGNSFQVSPVFLNLAFGTYTVTIKDALGCQQVTNAEISSNSLLPSPDFLVSTNNMKGDTFVIIDISNPRPDTISWVLPTGSQMLDSNMFAPMFVYDKTGSLIVTMKAQYGGCEMELSKTIYFTPYDSANANAGNNNGIEQLTVYPNPNDGTFNVEIKLYKKQTFVIQVFDQKSTEQYKQLMPAADYYFGSITIPQAQSGTYILKVTAEFDMDQKSIVVNK